MISAETIPRQTSLPHDAPKGMPKNTLILIVDDNPDDREKSIRALKKIAHVSYAYLEASGGDSMMDALGRTKPDCVLLDYSLPGQNGLDLLRQLIPSHPFLPVIMMTGQGNERIAVQSLKEGAQDYMVKSDITPENLHHHIRTAILQNRLEREQRELVNKLTNSNAELERFAYVASHDLQEPVRMVVSFSRLLENDYSDRLDAEGREYLRMVAQAGQRMRDMIEDLLSYSRLGNEQGRESSFAGNDALNGALENLRELIAAHKAEITFDSIPELYGNSVQILRLLQNLIANAIKYQPDDSIPRIRISVEDHGTNWMISITDNGLGIDPKYIEQIFQPFRRLHSWSQVQGSGLGLSICKKIVENHGGTMQVTSQLGTGSCFAFTLPKHMPQPMEVA